MEDCVLLNKQTANDTYGSIITNYTEGAEFSAGFRFDSSIEARAAEKQGVTSLYTIITSRSIVLQYHDVLRRKRDGKIFRVTSDGDDSFTPSSASLDMRLVTGEEWSLPNE